MDEEAKSKILKELEDTYSVLLEMQKQILLENDSIYKLIRRLKMNPNFYNSSDLSYRNVNAISEPSENIAEITENSRAEKEFCNSNESSSTINLLPENVACEKDILINQTK